MSFVNCDTSDGFSINVIDLTCVSTDYALYERTLHRIHNEIDVTIFYSNIFK